MTQRFPKQDHGVGGLSLVAPCAVSLPRSCGMSFQSFDHTTVKRRRFGTRPTVVSGKFPALFEISAPVLRCPAVMSWPQQSENGELVTRERIQHGPRRATSPSPRWWRGEVKAAPHLQSPSPNGGGDCRPRCRKDQLLVQRRTAILPVQPP
jgi:hypothetical protein